MKNGKREYEEKVRGAYPIDLDVIRSRCERTAIDTPVEKNLYDYITSANV